MSLVVKNPPANAGDTRNSVQSLGQGRSPGEGNGAPLQYSCLENSMGRGDRWATVGGVAELDITEQQQQQSAVTFSKLPIIA